MHILIVRNNCNPRALDASLLLATYLATQGLMYTMLDSDGPEFDLCPDTTKCKREDQYDLVCALGGDGTILKTARLAQALGIPILGINFGHLGFLANSSDAGVVEVVAAALAGDTVEERRSNLCIQVVCEGDDEEAVLTHAEPFNFYEDEQRSFFAFNEVVVNRGDLGRAIDFNMSVSCDHVAKMRGDGVIVATATGSTAYALSAGGPLVTPTYSGLIIVPLAPHSLQSRALLAGQSDIAEIELVNDSSNRDTVLFVDGERLVFERPVSKVVVRIGSQKTTLLRYKNKGFYQHASDTFFK